MIFLFYFIIFISNIEKKNKNEFYNFKIFNNIEIKDFLKFEIFVLYFLILSHFIII